MYKSMKGDCKLKELYTCKRNRSGKISIIPGGSYKDACDAGSLRKAVLFAVLWALGSRAGQLDTADKSEFLDGLLYPDGDAPEDPFFGRSVHNQEVTIVVDTGCDLEAEAENAFRFLDAYRQRILVNSEFLVGLMECAISAGDYLRQRDEAEGCLGRYEKFYNIR